MRTNDITFEKDSANDKKKHSFFLQSSAILLSDVSNPLIYITTRCTMKWYYYADILQLLDCI